MKPTFDVLQISLQLPSVRPWFKPSTSLTPLCDLDEFNLWLPLLRLQMPVDSLACSDRLRVVYASDRQVFDCLDRINSCSFGARYGIGYPAMLHLASVTPFSGVWPDGRISSATVSSTVATTNVDSRDKS